MALKIIIFLIFIFLLVGGLVFAYYYYEKPSQTNITHLNLSIGAEFEGKLIKTGYVLDRYGTEKQGNTTKGYVLEKILSNLTLKIYNKNLPGQEFYTDLREVSTNKIENYRIEFKLKQAKALEIEQQGELTEENIPINLTFSSEYYENLTICMVWTTHIIFVTTPYKQMEKPERLNVDKCFNTNKNLENSNLTIPISYQTFGDLEKDYIKFFILDSDRILGIGNKENVVGKDYEFMVKSEII